MATSSEKAQKRKYFKNAATGRNELCDNVTRNLHTGTSASSKVKIQPSSGRRSFSMKEKLQILKCLDTDSINSVCTKFGLHQSVLRRWQQKKEEIKAVCDKEILQNQKKQRTAANVDIDDALYVWFLQARMNGIPVSMSILQSKALALSAELGGNTNFRASNGWFYRWKLRKGIRRLTLTSEKLKTHTEVADKCKMDFAKIVKDRKLARAQIFNFIEKGLWFKTLPEKTLTVMHENQVPGFKN